MTGPQAFAKSRNVFASRFRHGRHVLNAREDSMRSTSNEKEYFMIRIVGVRKTGNQSMVEAISLLDVINKLVIRLCIYETSTF